MSANLTEIESSVDGLLQENISAESKESLLISPNRKIRVFVSSNCKKDKYKEIRKELKNKIEGTGLADVYLFEDKKAATLSAGDHYSWELEDSDVCIFLIDNADGVSSGVQEEVDIVKKYKIKALYYFCDERKKKKTALEKSLIGAQFAKTQTVHTFSDLSNDSFCALIDDITNIYHYYCKGKLVRKENEDEESQSISATEGYQLPLIPKATVNNVDKCRDYILKFVLGYSRGKFPGEVEKTSEFDKWGRKFLPILFEGKSIEDFNVALYMEALKQQQDSGYHQIVNIRWKAIQKYFTGDIESCIEQLESALKLAKGSKQPDWVIKDILVDLRNQQITRCAEKNEYADMTAQKELTKSNEELYYPTLDRLHDSLYEKYAEGLYEEKIESPYATSLGGSLNSYGDLLASSLVVSMYNGSLTHILLIYKRIKELVFYFSTKYSNWNLRLNLYKLAIFNGTEKEIKGIQNSYPEVLNNLTCDEATSIMEFCRNHPIKYKRLNSELLAFGAVGYFLDDKRFEEKEKYIIGEIHAWLNAPNYTVGRNIFVCLSGVAHRMSQESLSGICCEFIDKHCCNQYMDMFKFIARYIDLNKMSDESAQDLVQHICRIISNEKERKFVERTPAFLYVLRNQSSVLTGKIDEGVKEHLPDFYENTYRLETTTDKKVLTEFIQEYVDVIKKRNETQGKDGTYAGYSTRVIATVRNILAWYDNKYDEKLMDKLISAVAETILVSKEGISTKLDAVSLLICIVLKCPEDYTRNQEVFEKIFAQREDIDTSDHGIFSSNMGSISLKIGLEFLYISMGKDVYSNVIELMPYIGDNIATTNAVCRLALEYLELSDDVKLPDRVEDIMLQYVLQWLHSENLDVRCCATRMLLTMVHNADNYGILNKQLISLIDTDGAYVKNLIIRNLYKTNGITDDTRDYIFSKCKHDANYVVRMVCDEVEKGD